MRFCRFAAVGFLLLLPAFRTEASVVAHWKSDEGPVDTVASGSGSLLDSSGNGRHGTPLGGPIYRTVPSFGSPLGLEFDGQNDRVFIDDHSVFELTESLTLEALIRMDTVTTGGNLRQIVFRGDNRSGLDPYFLAMYDDLLFFHVNGGTAATNLASPDSVPVGQYVHVAATLNDASGEMKLFIDGAKVASTTTAVRPFAALDPLRQPGLGIGALEIGGQNFDGIIDEVRISDMALEPSQFLNAAVPEPATLLIWCVVSAGCAICRFRLSR